MKSYVKDDSISMKQNRQKATVSENRFLVPIDVKSLYCKIPSG